MRSQRLSTACVDTVAELAWNGCRTRLKRFPFDFLEEGDNYNYQQETTRLFLHFLTGASFREGGSNLISRKILRKVSTYKKNRENTGALTEDRDCWSLAHGRKQLQNLADKASEQKKEDGQGLKNVLRSFLWHDTNPGAWKDWRCNTRLTLSSSLKAARFGYEQYRVAMTNGGWACADNNSDFEKNLRASKKKRLTQRNSIEIDFQLKICWSIPSLLTLWRVHTRI